MNVSSFGICTSKSDFIYFRLMKDMNIYYRTGIKYETSHRTHNDGYKFTIRKERRIKNRQHECMY